MHPLTEFQKLALTAALAILAGIALEPLKIRIGEVYKKRKLRRMCYEQILLIRGLLTDISEALEKPFEKYHREDSGGQYAREVMPNINLGPLKYCLESEPGILYQLDVYPTVTRLVNELEAIKDDTLFEEMKRVSDSVVKSIDYDADLGRISATFLSTIAHEERWKRRSGASYLPKPVREIDNSYRKEIYTTYVTRPIITKCVFRIKRLRAWWRHLMQDAQPK